MIIVIVMNKKISTNAKIHFHCLNHVTLLAPLNGFLKLYFKVLRVAFPLKNKITCLFYKATSS